MNIGDYIFLVNNSRMAELLPEPSSDRWSNLPVETQLAFAKEEIEILKRQMHDIIGLYSSLPECRQYARCPGEVPQRFKTDASPDPKDREIANLRCELANARAMIHQIRRWNEIFMRIGTAHVNDLTKDVPCPRTSGDTTESCASRQTGSECAYSAESATQSQAESIVGTA